MLSRWPELVASVQAIPDSLHLWIEQCNAIVSRLQLRTAIRIASKDHFLVVVVLVLRHVVVPPALAPRPVTCQYHLAFHVFAQRHCRPFPLGIWVVICTRDVELRNLERRAVQGKIFQQKVCCFGWLEGKYDFVVLQGEDGRRRGRVDHDFWKLIVEVHRGV
jgi:hypothetical protein